VTSAAIPALHILASLGTDLGFTFPQVRAILDTQMSEPELRGVLRLRRAELAARVSADAARLERVEARLGGCAGPGGTTPLEPPAALRVPRGYFAETPAARRA
jgi:DNA-binding transcriptional MerR regulator